MASGYSDSESAGKQTLVYSTENHQTQADVLTEYHIIHGPEEPKDDTVSSESQNSISYQEADEKERQVPGSVFTEINSTKQSMEGHHVDKNLTKDVPEDQPNQSMSRIKCPPVNCKEKIIICLDLNEEMITTSFRSRAGDKFSGLELAKRALKMFVLHKNQMDASHEFAFMICHEESTMIQGFSSRPQDLLNTLEESEILAHSSGPLNLSKLFETVEENIQLPGVPENACVLPPPYIVRLLLIYGRSHSVPVGQGRQVQKNLETSPYFFTDVLYIHEPPSEDNKCEEIFNTLCELDHSGLSYIMESSKYTPIFTSGAKLLAHPLQRPSQDHAAYKIGSLPVAQVIDERCI